MKFCASYQVLWWQKVQCFETANFLLAANRYLNLNPQYLPQSLNKINKLQINKT
jgi:hypothetical protein